MGWTCQHDHKGYCKLLNKDCVPGIKGCILNKCDGIIFSSGSFEGDKIKSETKEEEIDFAKLAREN
ncbi:hypothetical protein HUE87_00855 [Candidatus Sulfurimonas marisnigri]|uniref:Uncharacterized protein n=1 Tax=Candidatus Sulfurimonas marisnigri TaxID=2740405 RepID=A0A7S7M0J3_9BACT|nr:hypothetical protein [Candidatus Sulfurimonas marisnigri]QOY54832.1 hypothetical protein HUE87_00855 [Candidatus Sulfurimonas marisnigri]